MTAEPPRPDPPEPARAPATGSWAFGSGVPLASEGGPTPRLAAVGDEVGGFELLEELGRGGMGVVFRARERATGREVALKLLQRTLTPEQRARFAREGELTARADHPGVVRVHSAGEHYGTPFLVYDLVAGGKTLASALAATPPLPRAELLGLLIAVAEAAGHLHRLGITHRDLKPENVLVDERGAPRVTDLGLAWAPDQPALTRSGAALGTPWTMAPEQLAGRREATGPPSDVWALGATLYLGLTGRRPFEAASLTELAARTARERPDPPRAFDPTISPALEAAVLRALAPDPRERFADGAALADALRSALAGGRGHAALRRAPRGLLAAAAAGVALLIVGGLLRGPARVARPRDPGAVARARALLTAPPEGAATDWAARLDAAREALALAPELAAEAHALRGRSLIALGRPAEAAAAFARAARASDDAQRRSALLLEAAQAHLDAGELAAAARRLGALGPSAARQPEAVYVGGRLELARGRLEQARGAAEALARAGPSARAVALQAALVAAEGGPPLPELALAVERWPDAPEPLLALLEQRFAREGDLAAAAVLLADGAAHHERLAPWRALLPALAAERADLGPLPLPPTLRAQAGAWLLAEAERELALRAWGRDPLTHVAEGAPAVAVRTSRARSRLAAARSLGASDAERLAAARALLDAPAPAPSSPADPARRAEAADLVERARRRLRRVELAANEALLEQALRLDPRCAEALVYLGVARVYGGRASRGLRDVVRGLRRHPRLLDELASGLGVSNAFLGPQTTSLRTDPRAGAEERLAAVLLPSIALEHGGRGAAPAAELAQALEAVLAADPAHLPARALLGLALVRAGRPGLAERHLAIVAEAAPDVGLVPFYQALARARRGAPIAAVCDALRRARALGLPLQVKGARSRLDAPELAPYARELAARLGERR